MAKKIAKKVDCQFDSFTDFPLINFKINSRRKTTYLKCLHSYSTYLKAIPGCKSESNNHKNVEQTLVI